MVVIVCVQAVTVLTHLLLSLATAVGQMGVLVVGI